MGCRASRAFFGGEWLRRSLNDRSPVMSFMWWPANNVESTYRRIIDLGLRLALVARADGWRSFRDAARSQTTFWDHALLQLEVAGFALRDGWNIEFEPVLPSGRSGDLRLRRNRSVMVVEVTSLGWGQDALAIAQFSERALWPLQQLQFSHNVSVCGEVSEVVPFAQLDAWLAEVESTATRIAGSGLRVRLDAPCSWCHSVQARQLVISVRRRSSRVKG